MERTGHRNNGHPQDLDEWPVPGPMAPGGMASREQTDIPFTPPPHRPIPRTARMGSPTGMRHPTFRHRVFRHRRPYIIQTPVDREH